jgi:hypothetical protein
MASRSAYPETLGDVFSATDKRQGLAGRQLSGGDRDRLAVALGGRSRVPIVAVEGEIGRAYASALGTRLTDIFVGAWSKLVEVARHADGAGARAGERHLVPLASHTITSRHEPRVEVLVDNVAALQIPLEVKLAARFEAAVLAIESGHVTAVKTGSFVATGTVGCRGVAIASVSSRKFMMPGEIVMSPPYAIPSLTGSAGKPTPAAAPAATALVDARSDAPAGRALVLSGVDDTGRPVRFRLEPRPGGEETTWVVGRRPEKASLVISHPSVSGEHARLRATARRGVEVSDLGSSNGTFVDGKRIDASYVSLDGAKSIAFGVFQMRVERG